MKRSNVNSFTKLVNRKQSSRVKDDQISQKNSNYRIVMFHLEMVSLRNVGVLRITCGIASPKKDPKIESLKYNPAEHGDQKLGLDIELILFYLQQPPPVLVEIGQLHPVAD